MLRRLIGPPRTSLDAALSWIERNSVYSRRVAWNTLASEARDIAGRSERPGCHEAIRRVLDALGDRHAIVLAPELVPTFQARWSSGLMWGLGLVISAPELIVMDVAATGPAVRAGVRRGDMLETVDDRVPRPAPSDTVLPLEQCERLQLTLRRNYGLRPFSVDLRAEEHRFTQLPRSRELDAGVAYLELPAVAGADATEYVSTAHRAIAHAEAVSQAGWIVDLRRNNGGDVYALLAAAGPLLGDGVVGGLVDVKHRFHPWTYREGYAFVDRVRRAGTSSPHRLRNGAPPVAVLVSRRTASAGEALAVAFRDGGRVRSFGEPTFGVPTGLEDRILSDQTLLGASTSFFANREGRAYEAAIHPDVAVESDWSAREDAGDQAIIAAGKWLQFQNAAD